MDNEERIRKWMANRPGRTSADASRTDDRDASAPTAHPTLTETASEEADRSLSETPTTATQSASIDNVRAEIDRRRTEKRMNLMRKAAVIVGIPLAFIFGYALLFATPLYTAEAAFTVQTEGDSGGPPPTAGLIALPGNSTMITDAFKARTFILSRPMMKYMEKEHGLMTHFAGMDFLSRPGGVFGNPDDPLTYYRKRVKVMIDIQDGIVRLEVDARTPEDAVRFGNAIVKATERHVNAISDRIATDQISGLTKHTDDAEKSLTDARIQLGKVRSRKGEISPEQSATVIYGLISNLELQLAEAQGQKAALLDDGLVNSPLLPPLNAKIEELKDQIIDNRKRLSSQDGDASLAQTASAFETATIAQEIALSRWQNMLEVLQQAYLQTLRERRYVVLIAEMSSNAAPKVMDWWSIARPILIFLIIFGGIVFALRRSGRIPDDYGHPKLKELVNRWR
ncbi:MAG: hypothetical protein R3E21_10160 [Caenibius sp.]